MKGITSGLANKIDETVDDVKGIGKKIDRLGDSLTTSVKSLTSSRDTSGTSTPTSNSSLISDPLAKLSSYDFSKDFEKAMFRSVL